MRATGQWCSYIAVSKKVHCRPVGNGTDRALRHATQPTARRWTGDLNMNEQTFPYTLEFGQENCIFRATRSVLSLKHAENAIAAVAPWSAGEGTPLPIPDPTRRLWRVDARAFGPRSSCPLTPKPGDATGHQSPPLFKVKLRL